MNFHYSHNEWTMYYRTFEIGKFIEEYNPRRTVRIELGSLVMENLYDIRFLYFSQYEHDGVLEDKETREWVKRRVFPKTRMNADELLRELGLSEYDPIEILKKNQGACCKDQIWIEFIPGLRFENLPYAKTSERSEAFWHYKEGFVPKTIQELGFNPDIVFRNRNDRSIK